MKMLIADDDAVQRRVLQALLKSWGYDVVPSRGGEEALALLRAEGAPRMAILDWMMPGVSGIEVCRRVRAELPEPYVYLVMLTARDRPLDILNAFEAGADDYISKPYDSHELRARVRAGQRIVELQSELIAARDMLRHQATHDSLTGLLNRRAVADALARESVRAGRERTSLAAVMLDLDHFKRVNDTHGHAAGDAVLRETARVISESARAYDTAGRMGGEEFVLLLPNCTLSLAVQRAEEIRRKIMLAPIFHEGREISVTVSAGVAASPGGSAPAGDGLLRAADEALYAAKHGGRNRVEAAPAAAA